MRLTSHEGAFLATLWLLNCTSSLVGPRPIFPWRGTMNGSHESWSALATLAVLAGAVASCAGGRSPTIQITPYSSSFNALPLCHDSEPFPCPAGANVVTLTAT